MVKTRQPGREDFLSYKALGVPLLKRRPTPADIRTWEAVSTFVTEDAARLRARLNRQQGRPLGDFIAKLVLPTDAPVAIGAISASGHCDLLGDPNILLASVESVVPV